MGKRVSQLDFSLYIEAQRYGVAGCNLLGHGYYALDEQKEYLLMFERAGARAFAEAVATED